MIRSLLFIIFLCGCNTRPKLITQVSDTVVKDIPRAANGDFLLFYSEKKAVENKLDIDKLENGFDSIQLRIWFGYLSCDTSQLITLRNINHNWSASVCSLIYRFNSSRTAIDSILKSCSNSVPASGWSFLAGKLTALQIPQLPDMDAIANYPLMTEGNGVVIEIATKTTYRTYSYAGLKIAAQNNIKEAKQLSDFIRVIEKELNFKTLRNFF